MINTKTILQSFVILLSALSTSCNGQNEQNNAEIPAIAVIPTAVGTIPSSVYNIRSMLHAQNGDYWFGADREGLYRYNGKTLILFTEKDGLSSNQVRTIQEDSAGNIWLETGRGICCYSNGSFSSFNNEILASRKSNTPAGWYKEAGDLWFCGGFDKGVWRLNEGAFYNYRFPGTQPIPPNSRFDEYDVYCIFRDRAGNIWIGTQTQGVCRFDGSKFTWFRDKGLAGPAIRTIFQDKAGKLWFGNNGAGLFCYDGKTLRNFTADKGLGNATFASNPEGTMARIWAINEDTAGNLWIGTIDAGLWRYDGKTLTNYTTKNGLTDDGITAIYKDRKGELWFGTAGELCKFNGKGFMKVAFKINEK